LVEANSSDRSAARVPVFPVVTQPSAPSLSEQATVPVESSAEDISTEGEQKAKTNADSPGLSSPPPETGPARQRTSIPALIHKLPEDVRQRFSHLNQRLDRLEYSIEQLENQLEDFDLDFEAPADLSAVGKSSEADDETGDDESTIAA